MACKVVSWAILFFFPFSFSFLIIGFNGQKKSSRIDFLNYTLEPLNLDLLVSVMFNSFFSFQISHKFVKLNRGLPKVNYK